MLEVGIVRHFFCCNKKATVKDDGNLMFSQRNNPYCELLQKNLMQI